MDTAARFWAKVAIGDCWEWTAARQYGYGVFRNESGRYVKAHRWAWEYLVGPIPKGLQTDHLCRNRACVNPDHLELVTARTNTLRSYNPPAMHARRETCAAGHPLVQKKSQRLCPICRAEYLRKWSNKRRRQQGVPEGRGAKWKAKTHCPAGHEYTEENTYRRPNGGYRSCRECTRTKSRESKQRRRQAG